MKQCRSGTANQYLKVSLWNNGVMTNGNVHRMVACAFLGDPPPGIEAAHENGIGTDNRLANLSWKTKLDNADDKRRHGTSIKGESNPRAKLRLSDVADIRALLADGLKHRVIADMFGVSISAISGINQGRTWTTT